MSPSLLCIGHRGAMGHAPENTLSSIRHALNLGATCIEIDVYYVDGELVVFHDDLLERTTNGEGYLSDKSFKYLRSLDAGKGERIPTLSEVVETIQHRACLNIELKGVHTAKPVAEFILEATRQGWMKEQFLVSSFNQRELVDIHKKDPEILLGALHCGLPLENAEFAEKLRAFSVHPSIEFLDKSFVDDAHARNLKVFVYTVNHPKDIARCAELGVDGVFTDFPERVLENYPPVRTPSSWKE